MGIMGYTCIYVSYKPLVTSGYCSKYDNFSNA